jgi:cytochrome oxidase Cu insertion factor (SCO1/SenC/PrrC family)
MKKNLIVTGLVLFALLLGACASSVPAADEEHMEMEVEEPQVVQEEPTAEMAMEEPAMDETHADLPDWYNWEFTDVNSGAVMRVADFQGKVVLVETLAMWCSNCYRQQQEVLRLHGLLGERDDFLSLGIDIDPNEDSQALSAYTAENGFDWVYTVASPEVIEEISVLYGVQYLNPPSTPMLIIDRSGEAHLLPFGIKSAEDLQSALEPYLNES